MTFTDMNRNFDVCRTQLFLIILILFHLIFSLNVLSLFFIVPADSPSSSTAPKDTVAVAAPVEDVLRIELRVGVVLSAEKHPDADSLYVEKVDCGDATGPRTIISGLAKFIPLDALIGKKVVVVCNLKPSKMRGIMSEGMLLAASGGADGDEVVELLEAPKEAIVGELLSIEGLPPSTPDTQLKSKSALDAWKRVASLLATDGDRVGTYKGPATEGSAPVSVPRKLLTSAGPCTAATLKGAAIG